MNILLINTNHFKEELEALGHKVITAAPPSVHHLSRPNLFFKTHRYDLAFDEGSSLLELIKKLPKDFKLDVILYYDDSRPYLYLFDIEESPVPTIFYSIDAHLHCNRHAIFGGFFDRVLTAMKDYVPEFQKFNVDSQWFPLWAPLTIEPAKVKDIDVCFRGSLDIETRPRRAEFFKRLQALVPVDAKIGDYRTDYPRSKIIINEVLGADLNCKVFESMMCGGMLLNPRTGNGLLDLFNEGVHLVTYEDGNAEEAAEKICYYLKNDAERERIAAAGRAQIMRFHTAEVRAQELAEQLAGVRVTSRRCRHYAASLMSLVHARVLENRTEVLLNTLLRTFMDRLSQCKEKAFETDKIFPFLILAAKELLETNGNHELSLSILNQLVQTYPNMPMLPVFHLDSLIKAGKVKEASLLASKVSKDPTRVLSDASRLTAELHEASPLTPEALRRSMGLK